MPKQRTPLDYPPTRTPEPRALPAPDRPEFGIPESPLRDNLKHLL